MRKLMRKVKGVRVACFALAALASAGAHCPPPGPCFKDIGPRPTVRVVLGEQVRDDEMRPNCGSLDGIISGSVLTLQLAKNYDMSCEYSDYRAEQIDGVPDVTLDPTKANYESAFAVADGDFSSSQSSGCRGTWSLRLAPSGSPVGPSTSPLDGTTGWLLTREMTIAQAQFCDGVFQEAGSVYCKDTFAVAGVTEVAP